MGLRHGILLAMVMAAASCAAPALRPEPTQPEAELRQAILREGGVDIVEIQYEEESGTAVVQLSSRDKDGKESVFYRWYHREGARWVPAPYVGAKRPDVP